MAALHLVRHSSGHLMRHSGGHLLRERMVLDPSWVKVPWSGSIGSGFYVWNGSANDIPRSGAEVWYGTDPYNEKRTRVEYVAGSGYLATLRYGTYYGSPSQLYEVKSYWTSSTLYGDYTYQSSYLSHAESFSTPRCYDAVTALSVAEKT
jgi:hypothetical protein